MTSKSSTLLPVSSLRTLFLAPWIAMQLISLLMLIGCSGDGGTGPEDDGTAPAPITDLSVIGFDTHSVTLQWTASGDDDMTGTATSYDLRYAAEFITYLNWDRAVPISGESAPRPAGSIETMQVTGLNENETYFFALSISDEESNSPGVSNCVTATCYENAEVTFLDAQLETAVRAQLTKPTGPLYRSDVRQLFDLWVESAGIADLTGLQECINLDHLALYDNAIGNLTLLANLTRLVELSLSINQIGDVTPLAGLTGLYALRLGYNQIDDISALS